MTLRSALAYFGLIALLTTSHANASWPNFGIRDFVRLLEQSGIESPSLEDALAVLPSEYRHGYTLMFDSQSAQNATPLSPRAILYGEDAHFIATFTGDDHRAEGNAIEMMEFSPREARFTMYTMHFPLKRDHDGRIPLPEKNPPLCLSCHQSDPKPLFMAGPFWAGSYGGFADSPRDSLEEKDFARFQSLKSTHPRYRFLDTDRANPNFPYRFVPTEDRRVETLYRYNPNQKLTAFLGHLNALRVARMLKESPNYVRYSPILLKALLGCPAESSEREREVFQNWITKKIDATLPKNARFRPDPSWPIDIAGNVIYLFGISSYDVAGALLDPSFLNVYDAFSIGSYVAYQIAADLIAHGDFELAKEIEIETIERRTQRDITIEPRAFDRVEPEDLPIIHQLDRITPALKSFNANDERHRNTLCELLSRRTRAIIASELYGAAKVIE